MTTTNQLSKSFIGCLLCFLLSFWVRFSYAQTGNYDDNYYLENHAVLYSNGDTPFSENGKWGMKNNRNETVLQPIYDSILNGGYDFCIVVKGGKYELLNKEYVSCFVAPMKDIIYSYPGFIVTDSRNRESQYYLKEGMLIPLDEGVNHAKKAVQYHKRNGTEIIEFDGDLVDYALVTERYAENNFIELHLKNKKVLTTNAEQWEYIIEDRFLFGIDINLQHYLIDLKSLDTVFNQKLSEGTELDVFEHNKQVYFITNSYLPYLTTIYSLDGKKIFQEDATYRYEAGFLMKAKAPRRPYNYHYEAFRFPGLEKNEFDFCDIESQDDFTLVKECAFGNYQLYANGILLQTWKETNEDNILFKGESTWEGGPIYYSVEHTKGKTSELTVFAPDGNLVYKSGYTKGQKSVSVESTLGLATIILEKENEDNRDIKAFTYNAKEKEVKNVHIDAFDQLSNEFFLYRPDDKTYFGDRYAKCVYDSTFDEIEIVQIDSIQLATFLKEDHGRICNDKLETICDYCFLAETQTIRPMTVFPEKFLIVYYSNENRYRVLGLDLKQILPESYLSVFYHPATNRFVALTENKEIQYIPNPLLK